MATASPASSRIASESTGPAPAAVSSNGNGTPQKPGTFDLPKPNLRGLNKPKCFQCGNVARSRCPFQCCKSCCYKAQNACHIHVLKQNNTLPAKPPPSISPFSEQPLTDSPSTGASWRLGSLRQLSHNFLSSLRAKKPFTKKDVANINKWRFVKLREHMQGDIEVENEAFERYMQKIMLLEETLSVMEDATVHPAVNITSLDDRMQIWVSEAKVRLKSDPAKEYCFKERIGNILDQKLKKLQAGEHAYNADGPPDQNQDDHMESVKLAIKQRMERTAKTDCLLDELRRAKSEDDLKHCMDLRAQLFGQENCPIEASNESNDKKLLSNQEPNAAPTLCHSFPKLWTMMDVNVNTLAKTDAEFSSMSEIVQL